ncbi:MAG TPA: hypothetical protein VNT79_10345 [Phycisphaerae bacterium]|nr:hypothetical protein [Phycisphaerae bacterium]
MPATIHVGGQAFHRVREYKHDFFAATGLYANGTERMVLKMGRQAPLLGVPLLFIGKFLSKREGRLLQAAAGVPGIPGTFGIVQTTGLLREYVDGAPLGRKDVPGDDFFPSLAGMLEALHARGMAYVDLEKPENILRGQDDKPYLIDFQISWMKAGWLGKRWPYRPLLRILQESDRYHLFKHWRRSRPDQLDAGAVEKYGRPPFWIRWHRFFFRPITLFRRQVLVWLGARESVRGRSPG